MGNESTPYDQLVEVMRSTSINCGRKGLTPSDIFGKTLEAVDAYALGKMEAKPMDRPKWLVAVKQLKEELKMVLQIKEEDLKT